MQCKISPQCPKKVQFHSARVQFQVDYDIPDDRRLRSKIPVWTEHWKQSKSSLIIALMRTLSLKQWLRLLFTSLILVALSIQLIQSFQVFLRNETLIEADYSRQHWPAVSLCIPFALPFCNGSCALGLLFNQSVSVFHRCKTVSKDHRSRLCSSPLLWIHESHKCFTYTEEEEDPLRLELYIESHAREEDSILVFVHKTKAFPFIQPMIPRIEVKRETDTQIQFFRSSLVESMNCSLSPFGDCLSSCLFHSCSGCVSRSSPLRSDLMTSFTHLCKDSQSECYDPNHCHSECPRDCEQTTFHLSTQELQSRDQSESNVTLWRHLTSPDLTLRKVPRTTCLQLLAQLGGLCAFWISLLWLLSRALDVISFFKEFFDIYFNT